jgi:hypothetical protein
MRPYLARGRPRSTDTIYFQTTFQEWRMKARQALIEFSNLLDDALATVHCTLYSLACPLIRGAVKNIPAKQLLYAIYISPRYKYVYVDNPKTGCSSLKSALVELEVRNLRTDIDCYDWRVLHNRDLSPMQQLTDLHTLKPLSYLIENGYQFISFVRNPYSRLLSGYRDKIRKPHYKKELLRLMGHPAKDLERTVTFEEFVLAIVKQHDYAMNPHWRPQTSQILYDFIEFSFLGRFEQYQENFLALFQHLGIPSSEIPSPRNLNWTHTSPNSILSEFYTPKLQDLVYRRYQKDFENFGYGYDL